MTSLYIEDFKNGLDVRRSVLTAEPGSLQTLDNCVVNPGGEIEKRMAFVKVATLPSGWTGLNAWNSGSRGSAQLFTWRLGTAGGQSTLLTIHATTGDIPILGTDVATPSGASGLVVQDVEEYGTGMHFVAGTVIVGGTAVFHNWWLGVNVPALVGNSPMATGQKMYRLNGSLINFSGVGDPSATNPLNPAGDGPNIVNPGAGFIDASRISSNSNNLVGMGSFYKQIAIFSQEACLLFTVDPDPANNVFNQYIGTGCISNGSIQAFGTGDLLFLANSGIRSLRALNSSLAAGVTDVGSPIDKIIQAAIVANPTAGSPPAMPNVAHSIIEPLTGRYWLAIANIIYVLSFWPSAKINAWSTFTLLDSSGDPLNVDAMTVTGTKVFVRSGLDIYCYGGLDGATYDTSVATVVTPLMPAGEPTIEKTALGIGAAVTGNWALSINSVPNNPTFSELVANLSGDSYSLQQIPFASVSTHFGFTLACSDASAAGVAALSVRFKEGREK